MSIAIRRVGIVAKPGLTEAADLLHELGTWLQARGITPCYETATAALASVPPPGEICEAATLGRDEQLMIVLGGDGTLLGTAGRLARAGFDVPVLAVNFGSLGFLTEVRSSELEAALDRVLSGATHEERRMMLEAIVHRADGTTEAHVALNDVVITKGAALSRMIDLAAYADGQLIAHFKADGLIVASPTGSTAYNLSAGGPIVHPGVDAVVLTPIAPHTLTNRPVVLPASAALEIRRVGDDSGDREETYVTFDGQIGDTLGDGDRVAIHRARHELRLLKPTSGAYFQVLRKKLRWAER